MHGIDRRRFLGGAAGLLALAANGARLRAAEQGTKLILLGTKGGPSIAAETGRHLPSQVILIRGVPYVVDCGLGVADQLARAHVPLKRLRYIFLTHQHSDHNLDYGNLIDTAWATGLTTPIDAWGPPPLQEMTRLYFEMNKYDIETRMADEGRPDPRPLVHVHEITTAGPVMQNDDVKVTAALVRHPPVVPSFAFRFDAADRSIVISGDTAYSPELIALARGADVLVHEAMYEPGIERLAQRIGNGATLLQHLHAAHSTTEEVGRVAAAAEVKLLVLSHLVPGDDASISDEMWTEGARRHFDGKIVVGRDLMEL